MTDKTTISWTDASWNPIRGCSRVSEECRNCYAEGVANRFKGPGLPYEGLIANTGQWNGKITVAHNLMLQPLRWRKPRRIFVNSMSDLFHENVSDETIDTIFSVMLACAVLEGRQHTFQVLTKRPERMYRYLTSRTPEQLIEAWAEAGNYQIIIDDGNTTFWEYVAGVTCHDWADDGTAKPGSEYKPFGHLDKVFPLPNLHLGVSAGNQAAANERLQWLMDTPAAVRWVSAEPLLGAINFTRIVYPLFEPKTELHPSIAYDVLTGHMIGPDDVGLEKLDWIVVGGESGPGARPMEEEWSRSIKEQCRTANVPFFMKQMGGVRDKREAIESLPEDLRIREFPA